MNALKNSSPGKVIGALRMQGHSVASWARGKAYQPHPNTVRTVIYRYCGQDREPRAILAARILEDLYMDTKEVAA